MTRVVLDASALLAVIRREPGFENVKPFLPRALISSVNVCEVIYVAMEKGSTMEAVQWSIRSLPIETIPFDDRQAAVAAALHKPTRRHGISFADRACLVLGLSENLSVVTSDMTWEELDLGVELLRFR